MAARGHARVGFGDVTTGYVYLEPQSASRGCSWADGFITTEMLARYKPFYEGLAGRRFHNAREVNEYMAKH